MLIVGGGPAGLSVAAGLPRSARVTLVQQDAEIGRPVRTSGGSFVRDLQALGLPERLWQRIDRLDFLSDGAEARFGPLQDPLAVLDITATWKYLATLSEGHDRELLCGTSLVGLTQEADGRFRARLRARQGGGERTIVARWVVDASGWKMAALGALGLANRPDRVGVGYEYELARGAFEPDRAVLFVGSAAPSGYGWVFPAPGGRLRVGIGVLHPDTEISPRVAMRAFEASGLPARLGLALDGAREVNAGILPSVPYDPRLRFGRVLRVGDSANMATPTVGEGIRIAIAEGRALGTALGKALAGREAALADWEAAARRRYRWQYRLGLMLNRRIAAYPPARWDRSLHRLARLDERAMIALLRNEFSPAMAARTLWLAGLGKLRRPGG